MKINVTNFTSAHQLCQVWSHPKSLLVKCKVKPCDAHALQALVAQSNRVNFLVWLFIYACTYHIPYHIPEPVIVVVFFTSFQAWKLSVTCLISCWNIAWEIPKVCVWLEVIWKHWWSIFSPEVVCRQCGSRSLMVIPRSWRTKPSSCKPFVSNPWLISLVVSRYQRNLQTQTVSQTNIRL